MNTEQLAEEIIIAAMIKCIEEHANASRVIAWMKDPKRKPAITAFTEGPERQIAYEFERVLDSVIDEVRNDESTWLVSKAMAGAYEDAAKIVEDCMCAHAWCDCCDSEKRIVKKLRKKAKEVGKQ